jgi:hypothetical protein
LEALYKLSTRVIDISICLLGSGVDQAMRALCDLVDLSELIGVRDWQAIDVHLDAIKLLRAHGMSMSEAERNAVVGGLSRVTRKRVGDPAEYAKSAGAAGAAH